MCHTCAMANFCTTNTVGRGGCPYGHIYNGIIHSC